MSVSAVQCVLQEKGLYQKILDQHEGQNSVAVREIELDLLRTLPTNKYYDRPDAQGVSQSGSTLLMAVFNSHVFCPSWYCHLLVCT